MKKIIITSIFLLIICALAITLPSAVQAQSYGCTYHASQRCVGNNLYWFDSCGNQQDLGQYCSNGCYNNSCQNYNNNNYNYNYNNNYGNCTYHAYRLCVGNSIYWYSGVCNQQQDLIQDCSAVGQVCQYGQCVIPIIYPVVLPVNNYVVQSRTACYGGSIHWFDSLGAESGLYKNCADNNTCTVDSCSGSKCLNTLKCDGSTCATGSADFNTYCQTTPVQPIQPAQPTVPNGIAVSFFTKQNANSIQWQKTTQVNADSQIYFMIAVADNSTAQVDNVMVSANIPTEVSSLGNLQINGVPVSGDIVSGVNIGSVAPSSTKSITFEGKTQAISTATTKSSTATTSVSGNKQSDSVTISLNPSQNTNQNTAAVSSTTTNGFWEFIKKWYLWILVALVLLFLFIVVFKRFSSEV